MKPYLVYTLTQLKLTWRDRMVVFFNYLFPLIFYFVFAFANKAEQGGAINTVFTSVVLIGILGNGFFGGGIRAVVEREANILRRFRVAPITPLPILVSAILVGLVSYLPSALLTFAISYFAYQMPLPKAWLSALVMIIIGTIAFRAMGQIIASVASTMSESQIIIQLLYFPMLFLSGATFPLSMLPDWLQIVTQFIPATHLYNGLQNILVRGESLGENLTSAGALVVTTVLCVFLSFKMFRWEKGEKLRPGAKYAILASLLPFAVLGVWQAYSKDNLAKAKAISREARRGRSLLFREVRFRTPDGIVAERGAVLVRQGRIAALFPATVPDAKELRAEPMEGAGKTLLPGLIDSHVTLLSPGGTYEAAADYVTPDAMRRTIASYLYSGVAALVSAGEDMTRGKAIADRMDTGERLGPQVWMTGPMLTVKDGPGSEQLRFLPENIRPMVAAQILRIVASPDEARAAVRQLQGQGARAIKTAPLPDALLSAIVAEAKALRLPVFVATSQIADLERAVAAGADVVAGGAVDAPLSEALVAEMVRRGVAYMPMLAPADALGHGPEMLERSLVQQIGPAALLASTKKKLPPPFEPPAVAAENLKRAAAGGVKLLAGSGAGSFLVFHGSGLQRELVLWQRAGLRTEEALAAATATPAALFGVSDRMGSLRLGADASLLLINGNAYADLKLLDEAISMVVYKGEVVRRTDLLNGEEN